MRLAFVFLATLLVVACASPSVPALRVTRYSEVPENHYPAFDRSVDNAAAARRVSDALRALPSAPKDRFCPAGFGLRYRLTFNEAGRVTLLVVIEGDACAEAIFSESDRRATNDAFWDLLADTLGVNQADIYYLLPNAVKP